MRRCLAHISNRAVLASLRQWVDVVRYESLNADMVATNRHRHVAWMCLIRVSKQPYVRAWRRWRSEVTLFAHTARARRVMSRWLRRKVTSSWQKWVLVLRALSGTDSRTASDKLRRELELDSVRRTMWRCLHRISELAYFRCWERWRTVVVQQLKSTFCAREMRNCLNRMLALNYSQAWDQWVRAISIMRNAGRVLHRWLASLSVGALTAFWQRWLCVIEDQCQAGKILLTYLSQAHDRILLSSWGRWVNAKTMALKDERIEDLKVELHRTNMMAMDWDTRMRIVKEKVEDRLAGKCPDISIDIDSMAILLKDQIKFKPGKADIQEADLRIMRQLERTVVALSELLEDQQGLCHIRIDGHVHPTGKDMRCLVISYFRAAEIVRRIRKAGCPADFLLAYGYGQRQPISHHKKHADANRRVEITIIDQMHYDKAQQGAMTLWSDISSTREFNQCITTEKFFGETFEDLSAYCPPGARLPDNKSMPR